MIPNRLFSFEKIYQHSFVLIGLIICLALLFWVQSFTASRSVYQEFGCKKATSQTSQLAEFRQSIPSDLEYFSVIPLVTNAPIGAWCASELSVEPYTDYVFEIAWPHLSLAKIFVIYPNGQIEIFTSGDIVAETTINHRFHIAHINSTEFDHVRIAVFAKGQYIRMPVNFWQKDDFERFDSIRSMSDAIVFGGVLYFLLFAFFNSRLLKDQRFVSMALMAFTLAVFQLSFLNYGYVYIWPNSTSFSGIIHSVCLTGITLFMANTWLSFSKNVISSNVKLFVKIYQIITLIFLLFYLIFQSRQLQQIIEFLSLVMTLMHWLYLCQQPLRRQKFVGSYVLFMFIYIVLVTVYSLQFYGGLPAYPITENLIMMSLVIITIGMLTVTSQIYQQDQQERFELLNTTLKQENKLLIAHQEAYDKEKQLTDELEKRVKRRTNELNEALGELHVKNLELRTLSSTDALTKLLNRYHFDEVLDDAWKQASSAPLFLAFIDVDFFKKVNDRYGHDGGDECLRHLANVMVQELVSVDIKVARFGGEEFVALFQNKDYSFVEGKLEQLRQKIENSPVSYNDQTIKLTVSIGFAQLIASSDNGPRNLIKRADNGVYTAKQSGRNQVCYSDVEM